MTIDDQIRDKKLQYNINREAAKIPASSSDKIHNYEYLTSEDILPSNQQQIIEQAKFTYSRLGKAFEKQVEALNDLKSDNKKFTIEDVIPKSAFANDKAKEEFNKIKKIEDTIDRKKLVYKASGNTYDFRKFTTIRTFGEDISDGKINLEEADKNQSDLLNEIKNLMIKQDQKTIRKNKKKKILLIVCIIFLKQEKWLLMLLKVKYF